MRRGRQETSFETCRSGTNTVNVVLCALPTTFSAALSAQAEKAGCRVVGRCQEDVTELRATIDARTPQLLVTNLDVPGGLPLIETARAAKASDLIIAAVTEIPSLVRVAAAVRRGASTVVARPATLGQILAATGSDCASLAPVSPMSLDRAIWEFLNQALIEAGSISEAARRLRLDRTSFKRMLRKVPPS